MFFKNLITSLSSSVKNFNNGIHDAANSENAKKLKKRLLKTGAILLVVGITCIITSIALFICGATKAVPGNIPAGVIIGSILTIPSFITISLGSILLHFGLAITVASATTNVITNSVGEHCPNCNCAVSFNDSFCSKCGTPVKKQCPNCSHTNSAKNAYCEKCGTKLQ